MFGALHLMLFKNRFNLLYIWQQNILHIIWNKTMNLCQHLYCNIFPCFIKQANNPFFKVQQRKNWNAEKETALSIYKSGVYFSSFSLFKTGLPPSRLVRQWWFSLLKVLVSFALECCVKYETSEWYIKTGTFCLVFSTKWILCENSSECYFI